MCILRSRFRPFNLTKKNYIALLHIKFSFGHGNFCDYDIVYGYHKNLTQIKREKYAHVAIPKTNTKPSQCQYYISCAPFTSTSPNLPTHQTCSSH